MKELTLQQLNARIKKQNKAFAKMSPEEKRVVIAEDCILRINMNNLVPRTGSIVTPRNDWDSIKELIDENGAENDVKTSLENGLRCNVCAKGGLLLSYIGRVNSFKFEEFSIVGGDDLSRLKTSEHQKLMEIFDPKQLALIETAFEETNYMCNANKSLKVGKIAEKKAIEFYNRYGDSENRLYAICENIIENNGTFKP